MLFYIKQFFIDFITIFKTNEDEYTYDNLSDYMV